MMDRSRSDGVGWVGPVGLSPRHEAVADHTQGCLSGKPLGHVTEYTVVLMRSLGVKLRKVVYKRQNGKRVNMPVVQHSLCAALNYSGK